jgi:hypothetical protein
MTQQFATVSASPGSNAATASPAARTKLLLNGPILPTLLRLAAPNILNLLAFVGVIVFDGFFLGRIGTDALAGASLAFPFVMLVLQTTNSGMGAVCLLRLRGPSVLASATVPTNLSSTPCYWRSHLV